MKLRPENHFFSIYGHKLSFGEQSLPTKVTNDEKAADILQPPTPAYSATPSQLLGVYIDRQDTPPRLIVHPDHGSIRDQRSIWARPSTSERSLQYNGQWEPEDIDRVLAQGQVTVQDVFRDNLSLAGKVSALEDAIAQYQQDKRLQSILNNARQQGCEMAKLRKILEQKNLELYHIKQQTHSMKILESSFDLKSRDPRQMLGDILRTHSEQMTIALHTLAESDVIAKTFRSDVFLTSPDLMLLGNRAFGGEKLRIVLSLEPQPSNTILQSLIGAAICEWVLRERLQWMATISSPMLQAWKRHVGALCKFFVVWNDTSRH